MKTNKESIWKNNIFRSIIGVLVLIIAIYGLIALFSRHSANYSTTAVSVRDLTQTVEATGSVVPEQNVMLAFNMQGRVSFVNVNVGSTTHAGDILAGLDVGTLNANVSGAVADFTAANAHLDELKRGARPEELALYTQKYNDASSALIVAMKNAYLQTENAITGKTDIVFTNGNSANPNITIRTQSQTENSSINSERISVTDKLAGWKSALSQLSSGNVATSSLSAARTITTDALFTIKAFADHLGSIANNLNVGNSGMTQVNIDAVRSAINAGGQQITGATTAEQTVEAAWSAANDSLSLEQAGSTAEAIISGQSAVDKAQATILGIENQMHQAYIVSPFDGIVTAVNVKVGEIYVPGISATMGIGLMSNGNYKIEVYVPETDVAKISAGNSVSITLDAYGENTTFAGHVTLVDPAETIQGGTKVYKITIHFDTTDSRIKSGLTGNVIITTTTANSAVAVPKGAIMTRGTDKFVLLKSADSNGFTEQSVTTGIQSSDGYVEILSGLSEGDTIASFGNNQ